MSRPQSLVATSTYVFVASLVVFGVATSVLCCDNSLSYISFIFPNLSELQGASLVATSIPCRDINLCRDITMLSRHHSFSFCSILSCLSCDPCRDLHQISFNFLDVATSNMDCANPKTATLINQLLSFLLCHLNCTFTPPIAAFFYCFVLLFFTLPANNKLVSFFIFMYINCPFFR